MSELNVSQAATSTEPSESSSVKPVEKQAWETPKIEDVSEQVMAQPYIRFT